MGDVREKRLKVGIGFLEREIAVLARPGGAPASSGSAATAPT